MVVYILYCVLFVCQQSSELLLAKKKKSWHDHTWFTQKFKVILENQLYITCFYHVISNVFLNLFYKYVDLLLKLSKMIR